MEKTTIPNKDRFGIIQPSERIFVSKGWGWEEWIHNNERYCGKKMFCKQGKMCSWHYHKIKEETFLLISGMLRIDWSTDNELPTAGIQYYEDVSRGWSYLVPSDVFHIPVGLRHRFQGIQDSLFIEFSSQHFDEDSIRLIKGD